MMNDAVARAFPLAEDAGEDAYVTTQVVVIKDTPGENIRAKISLKMAQMRPVTRNLLARYHFKNYHYHNPMPSS